MFFFNGLLSTGDTINLPVDSVALLYGATVFTTLRVYDGSLDHPLTHWQKHCDRTSYSLEEFGWKMPDWQRIKQESQELSKTYPVLRIAIFPDGKELILGRKLPSDLIIKQQQGVKGKCQNVKNNGLKRSLPNHKTGNYLAPYLGLEMAKKEGFGEIILIDSSRNWLETSTGNLWGYADGCWFTPRLEEGILGGIARGFILENANFPVQENVWTLDFVKSLRAIVYSNSVVEIIPFNSINIEGIVKEFNLENNPIKQIKKLFYR